MAEKHGGTVYGPYLDDIADFVSFGLSPAYIIFQSGGSLAWIFGLIFFSGVAYRLIRFVTVDKKRSDLPEGIFNGLPSRRCIDCSWRRISLSAEPPLADCNTVGCLDGQPYTLCPFRTRYPQRDPQTAVLLDMFSNNGNHCVCSQDEKCADVRIFDSLLGVVLHDRGGEGGSKKVRLSPEPEKRINMQTSGALKGGSIVGNLTENTHKAWTGNSAVYL